MPTSPRRRRPLLPLLLVAGAVLGVATSVGAQVDPVFPSDRAVWAASCVPPGASELVAYGRGWAAGPVSLAVTDQAGASVGTATASAADREGGAAFQGRVSLSVPGGVSALRLVAVQAGVSSEQAVVVSGSCSLTIAAVVDAFPCASAGRAVNVSVIVRGAPVAVYDAVLHHADLYGPAEAVDRSQPRRPDGDYSFPLTVRNAPDRVVPVTVEARRPDGTFAFATTTVGLPPACSEPTPLTTASPAAITTFPSTAPPGGATTMPFAPGALGPPGPSPFQPPRPPATSAGSLVLSPALGPPGGATTAFGRGFAPGAALALRWRPGIGRWAVTVAADGSFRAPVLVLPKDVEGPRVLEVVGAGTASDLPAPYLAAPYLAAPYLVVPGSEQPAFGGVFVRG